MFFRYRVNTAWLGAIRACGWHLAAQLRDSLSTASKNDIGHRKRHLAESIQRQPHAITRVGTFASTRAAYQEHVHGAELERHQPSSGSRFRLTVRILSACVLTDTDGTIGAAIIAHIRLRPRMYSSVGALHVSESFGVEMTCTHAHMMLDVHCAQKHNIRGLGLGS